METIKLRSNSHAARCHFHAHPMIYSHLYRNAAAKGPVRVGLIGVGHYGTAVLTQSMTIPLLHVAAVADNNLDAAKRAFAHAGES